VISVLEGLEQSGQSFDLPLRSSSNFIIIIIIIIMVHLFVAIVLADPLSLSGRLVVEKKFGRPEWPIRDGRAEAEGEFNLD